ncbi:MAG: hypothetical protein ABR936_10375 [Bacteroidota bacterium]
MKISFLFMLVLLLLFVPSIARQTVDSTISISDHNQRFDPKRDVKKDIQDAINLAK